MPELPEVEVVRAGLARHVVGRTVTGVDVLDPRPLRRQDGGAQAFVDQLTGRTLTAAVRRGKFLWLSLDDGRALSVHLGMSGQLLVRGTAASAGAEAAPGPVSAAPFLVDPDTQPNGRPVDLSATEQPRYVRDISTSPRHLRVRIHLSTDPSTEPSTDDGDGGDISRMRASRRAIKTLLLDQGIVSGIGNIYADEGLWESGVHGLRPGTALGPRVVARILESTAEVMTRALEVGGTSFDALYVDVEGAAGFFARELGAYGRQGLECHRCGATMLREVLGGRSHTYCPGCQTRPRRPGRPQWSSRVG